MASSKVILLNSHQHAARVCSLHPQLASASSTYSSTSHGLRHHGTHIRPLRQTSSFRIYAQKPAKDEKPTTPKSPPSLNKKTSTSQDQDEDYQQELEEAFKIFDLSLYSKRWSVPWGAKETIGGMAAWAGSFILVGVVSIPILGSLAGPAGFSGLSQHDKSVFALVNQIAETIVGIAVINFVVSKNRPLPPDVLKLSLDGPFRKPDGWLAWGLLGVLCSPFVVYAASAAVDAFGADDVTGRGTADAVSQIITFDGDTFTSLFITTAILAPLLEETVFRGFLLPSLTKWMPTPAAVVLSSVAFGMVHLSPRDFPQLTALGMLLGFVYIRSRNLLAPMMIHGAWNGTVLAVLFALKASGYDLQKLLHGGL